MAASFELLPVPLSTAIAELLPLANQTRIDVAIAYLRARGLSHPESLLDGLRDRSLLWSSLESGTTRLGIYAVVRRYAAETAAADAGEHRLAHARYFSAQGLALRARSGGRHSTPARKELVELLPQLELALDRCEGREWGLAADLVASMAPIIAFRGPVSAHRTLLLRGVAAADRTNDPERRARARTDLAWSYIVRGLAPEARAWLSEISTLSGLSEEAMLEAKLLDRHLDFRCEAIAAEDLDTLEAQARRLEAPRLVTLAMSQAVLQMRVEGEELTTGLAERLERHAQTVGSPRALALAHYYGGRARRRTDPPEAERRYGLAQAGFTELGEACYVALTLTHRSFLAADRGAFGEALALLLELDEGLDECLQLDDHACALLLWAEAKLQAMRDPAEAWRVIERATLGAPRGRAPTASELIGGDSASIRATWQDLLDELSPSPVVALDGSYFEVGGQRVSLVRRRAVRRILSELARVHHEARERPWLLWEELFEVGWPDREPEEQGGRQRAYTAVWTLRRLGLADHLEASGEGYRLVRVSVRP